MKILLAVDDNEPSYRAAEKVAEWFDPATEVVVLHVGAVESGGAVQAVPAAPAGITGGGVTGLPFATLGELPDAEGLREQGREVARRAAGMAGGEARVEEGDAADTIKWVAAEIGADVIAVGTGDRSIWSRLFKPSVSADLASDAPCSVLIVRPDSEA